MEKVLLEYGKEAEIIGPVEGGWRVRIVNGDEVTEKTVKYKPIPADGWKYADDTIVEKEGKFYRLKKYTTYCVEGGLVYAYKVHEISRFSDRMAYEHEIAQNYKIPETLPFLTQEEINELTEKEYEEKSPLIKRNRELEDELEKNKNSLKEITKKFDIQGKCLHKWEENGQEKLNNGRTIKKDYYCSVCEKEDSQYWHKL